MNILPLALVLVAVHAVAQRNDDELIGIGTSFYSNCESVETFKKGQEKTAQMKAAYCLGFVEGLKLGIMATEISTWNKTFCQPDNITNVQNVRIVRKYIADNPQRAHEPAALLAVEALHKTFLAPDRPIEDGKVFHQAKFPRGYDKPSISRKPFVA
jgi:hypothetical protein